VTTFLPLLSKLMVGGAQELPQRGMTLSGTSSRATTPEGTTGNLITTTRTSSRRSVDAGGGEVPARAGALHCCPRLDRPEG
jgi:hypothetical protein